MSFTPLTPFSSRSGTNRRWEERRVERRSERQTAVTEVGGSCHSHPHSSPAVPYSHNRSIVSLSTWQEPRRSTFLSHFHISLHSFLATARHSLRSDEEDVREERNERAAYERNGRWMTRASLSHSRSHFMTRLSITSSGHRLSPPSCDHCWWLKGLEVIVRRWERSVSRVSRLSFGSPFVTQSLPVPTAHLPQLGGRLLTSPPTSLRSAHGTNERSDVRRERERHATRHSSLRSRFVWRVSLFTTSPISYLVHRSVSLLSSLVHDGWC